jgi:hypothetical protein
MGNYWRVGKFVRRFGLAYHLPKFTYHFFNIWFDPILLLSLSNYLKNCCFTCPWCMIIIISVANLKYPAHIFFSWFGQ